MFIILLHIPLLIATCGIIASESCIHEKVYELIDEFEEEYESHMRCTKKCKTDDCTFELSDSIYYGEGYVKNSCLYECIKRKNECTGFEISEHGECTLWFTEIEYIISDDGEYWQCFRKELRDMCTFINLTEVPQRRLLCEDTQIFCEFINGKCRRRIRDIRTHQNENMWLLGEQLDIEECEEASKALGLTFQGGVDDIKKYPVGCFVHSTEEKTLVYHNSGESEKS